MTIEYSLDTSNNLDLLAEYGEDEIELRVECDITGYENEAIEGIEFYQVEVYGSGGWTLAEGDLESEILRVIENDFGFTLELYKTAAEEKADHELERRIQARENERERIDEARCWAGVGFN